MKKRIALEVKLNNCASNDPCAICSGRTAPMVGLELFLSGTVGVVCHECGEKYDAALTKALKIHREQLREYEQVIEGIGQEKWGLESKLAEREKVISASIKEMDTARIISTMIELSDQRNLAYAGQVLSNIVGRVCGELRGLLSPPAKCQTPDEIPF
ncbi:MAG: hypothetical protein FJ135_07105 [Deltaproteobacteria bacterium]|nr:hypothetical protein [Deltaproteobacteria bacterium]